MIDYYVLTGFHCDTVPDRRLSAPACATTRATRDAKASVRMARDLAQRGGAAKHAACAKPARVIPVAIKPSRKPSPKPVRTV